MNTFHASTTRRPETQAPAPARRPHGRARGAAACYPFIVALSALASLLVAGCGGGGNDVTDATLALPQAELQVQALAKVRLEGCVVDGQWMGAPGTAVHVRMADGRAVGTAITNAQGVFVMAVPAQSAIVLDTDVQATGGLVLNTGNAALSVAGCLVAGL